MPPKKKPAAKKGAIKIPKKVKTPAKPPTPPRSELQLSEQSSEDEESNISNNHAPPNANITPSNASGSDANVFQSPPPQVAAVNRNDEEQEASESESDDSESESDSTANTSESSSESEIDEINPPRGNSTRVSRNEVQPYRKRQWQKAGLKLPCNKFANYIKKTCRYRFNRASVVYLTAAVQYVLEELLDGSAEKALAARKKTITPRHLMLSVMDDEELRSSECWPGIIFAGAGVVGGIHPALRVPPRRRVQARAAPSVTQKSSESENKKKTAPKRAINDSGSSSAPKKRRLQPTPDSTNDL